MECLFHLANYSRRVDAIAFSPPNLNPLIPKDVRIFHIFATNWDKNLFYSPCLRTHSVTSFAPNPVAPLSLSHTGPAISM